MKQLDGLTLLFVLVLAVTIVLAAQTPNHGGRPITTTLTGAAEVPGPGDADGAGIFKATFNPGQNEMCYELSVSNIATATAAHLHTGTATEAGPVLITLKTPSEGSVKECIEVDRETVKAIIQKPAGYYVNVHNADFSDGAIRGQLSK